MHWLVAGSLTHAVGVPLFIGMPSAPGYVPKYESNDRFSCWITMMCLILWMSPGADAGVAVTVDAVDFEDDEEPLLQDATRSTAPMMQPPRKAKAIDLPPPRSRW